MPRLVKLCLKPETSEMQQKRFHAIVKVKIFSTFPAFPKGTSGRAAICSPSAVLKNRYFRPCRSRISSNGHGPRVRSVRLLLFEAAKQGSLENLEFALGLPGGKSYLGWLGGNQSSLSTARYFYVVRILIRYAYDR